MFKRPGRVAVSLLLASIALSQFASSALAVYGQVGWGYAQTNSSCGRTYISAGYGRVLVNANNDTTENCYYAGHPASSSIKASFVSESNHLPFATSEKFVYQIDRNNSYYSVGMQAGVTAYVQASIAIVDSAGRTVYSSMLAGGTLTGTRTAYFGGPMTTGTFAVSTTGTYHAVISVFATIWGPTYTSGWASVQLYMNGYGQFIQVT